METSYFLSRDIVIPTIGSGMALWREKLFASMHRNAAAAADFLHLGLLIAIPGMALALPNWLE